MQGLCQSATTSNLLIFRRLLGVYALWGSARLANFTIFWSEDGLV